MTIDQRLLMRTSSGVGLSLVPRQFSIPIIRKLAKIWRTLNYIVGLRWENCTAFLRDVTTGEGHKNFGIYF